MPGTRARPSVAFASLALFLVACRGTPSAPRPDVGGGILLIGNSLTASNDLASLVARVASTDGRSFAVEAIAPGNTALIDHAEMSSTVRRIVDERWSAVVLQQGPTTPGICRDTLVLATVALDRHIRGTGARTATLMTWPYDGFPDAFAWVHESAKRASDAVRGDFLPAGDAWQLAMRRDPSIRLYGGDGYHPSPLGSLLTALVIYEGLTGRDVRQLPLASQFGGMASERVLLTLAESAHDATIAARVETPTELDASIVRTATPARSC